MIILRFTGTNDTLCAWLPFLCWPMITQEQSQSFSLIVAGGSKSECFPWSYTTGLSLWWGWVLSQKWHCLSAGAHLLLWSSLRAMLSNTVLLFHFVLEGLIPTSWRIQVFRGRKERVDLTKCVVWVYWWLSLDHSYIFWGVILSQRHDFRAFVWVLKRFSNFCKYNKE